MYLLDTNVVIGILNNTAPGNVNRLNQLTPGVIRLCSMVKSELLFGARKSARVQENLKVLEKFFYPYESLPFNDRCAEHYGVIRADLVRVGTMIGPNDLVIAAITKAHDLTLVTHNTEEFSRVFGLRLEDWEEPK